MLSFTLPLVFRDISLLLVRLVLTVTFAHEAQFKLKDIRAFAKNDSLPVPMAYFVATVELLAALSMFTGLLAQWAGAGLVLLMLITTGLHLFKWHSPYWASKSGWEYDVLMLVLAGVIAVFGAGDFSI